MLSSRALLSGLFPPQSSQTVLFAFLGTVRSMDSQESGPSGVEGIFPTL